MNLKSNKRKSNYLNLSKYFSLILVLCLWVISPQLKAQSNSSGNTKIVKGIVLDELSDPMIGVNVMEKGTKNGTITDFNGKFQLKVASSGAKIIVTYIGYAQKEVVVGTSDLKIQMATDAKMIDEVVVIGYGTQKKATMVGAVTQASSDDLRKQGTVVNLTQALTGSMPGVTVLNTSGSPGGSTTDGYSKPAEILIRGKNTWNNNSPLIMVDGIERDMNDVDINEVETVTTLKDASATAVFGMKGGNGVILITTKRGLIGKPKLSIEANNTYETISKYPNVLSAYPALTARNYAIINEVDVMPSSWTYYMNDQTMNHYRLGDMPYAFPDNDWQDILLKDFGTSNRMNMNVSGGTNFVKYFGSLSYLHEGDIMNSQDLGRGYNPEFSYNRFNVRTNLDFTITKTTTLKTSISGMYGRQQQHLGDVSVLYSQLWNPTPTSPVIMYEDGVLGRPLTKEFNNENSFQSLNFGGSKINNRLQITSDFALDQKLDFITKGLAVKGKLAYDNFFGTSGPNVTDGGVNPKYIFPEFYLKGGKYNYETKQYEMNGAAVDMVKEGYATYVNTSNSSTNFGWTPSQTGYSTEGIDANSSKYTLYYEISLNYAREFGKHGITALALFSRQKAETGSDWAKKREDWVGRVTYDYNKRYFAEVNGAYNGSEAFGPGYKFDFFPSVAIGWNIANEKFFKEFAPFMEVLKVKYSNGLVGNDNVNAGNWPYQSNWETGSLFGASDYGKGFGITPITSYTKYQEGTPGNPELHWEKANKQNLGTEFSLFKGLISGSVDLFKEHRYDMLIAANDRKNSVPIMFGQTPPAANIGEVKSRGMEIEASISKSYRNGFNFKVGGSWTYARNEILYKEDAELKPFYQKAAGYPIGQNRLTIETGLMTSWDDVYNGVISQDGNTNRLPGDFVFMDYNANGKIDKDDSAPYGYPVYPFSTYTANLSTGYKGWSLDIMFYGTQNVSREVGFGIFEYSGAGIQQLYLDATATPEYGNANPTFPQLNFGRGAGTGTFNTYDGSLLRLKSLQIAYSLPKRWVKKIGCSDIRLYANGNNLFVWTDMPADGEGRNKGDDLGRNYPLKRTATIGTSIKF